MKMKNRRNLISMKNVITNEQVNMLNCASKRNKWRTKRNNQKLGKIEKNFEDISLPIQRDLQRDNEVFKVSYLSPPAACIESVDLPIIRTSKTPARVFLGALTKVTYQKEKKHFNKNVETAQKRSDIKHWKTETRQSDDREESNFQTTKIFECLERQFENEVWIIWIPLWFINCGGKYIVVVVNFWWQ